MKDVLARLVLIVACAGLSAQAVRAESRCRVYRIDRPVKLDGLLDDAAWRHVPTTTGFVYLNQSDTYAELQTTFQIGYDGENLYVGIRAEEPRIAEHLAFARKNDTGEVNWKFQLMEVFLDPPAGEHRDHYQFALDLLGNKVCYRAQLDGKPYSLEETKWDKVGFPWQGVVRHGSDHFVMEMAFPLKAFKAAPKNCDEWGLQIGRHGTWATPGLHWKIANWTQWRPMLTPKWRACREHGTIEFVDRVLLPDDQNVGRETTRINRDYYAWKATRGKSAERVRELVARTEGHIDVCHDKNNPPRCFVFGQARGPTHEEPPPNWTWHWWFNNTGNPETAVLEWKKPVEFNCTRIEWYSSMCYGLEYSLEYWTGAEWKMAYQENANALPVSCHVFPAVTTQKARLTVTRTQSDGWFTAIVKFELYRIDDADLPEQKQ